MIFDKLEEKRGMTYEDSKRFTWKGMNSTSVDEENLLKESTYFKCIDYTSKKVASLTFDIKQFVPGKGEEDRTEHRLYEKLKLRPNNAMNMVNMMRCLVTLGEHEGLSCLYIDPYTDSLYPCKINKIYIDNVGLIDSMKEVPVAIEIVCNNITKIVPEEYCIMYSSGITLDGINSKPIKDYLKDTIKTTVTGQKVLSELFANGLTNKAIVQLTSDIKNENDLKKIQAKFQRLFSSEGRIFTVPAGYNVSSLNLSLADSQFKELRNLSRREIASCFGLTPSMIGDVDSKATDIEEENLRYLTDTLLVKINSLEQEFNYKYLSEDERKEGYKIRLNFNVLLRSTAEKQKNIIVDYVKNGIYPLEYARALLGVPLDNEGIVTLPSGQVLLKDLLNGNATWQKGKKGGGDE